MSSQATNTLYKQELAEQMAFGTHLIRQIIFQCLYYFMNIVTRDMKVEDVFNPPHTHTHTNKEIKREIS